MTTTASTEASETAGDPRGPAVLRRVGAVLVVVGAVLVLVGIADLRGMFDRTMDVVDVPGLPGTIAVDDGPRLFWAFILGLPVLLAGGASLLLGHPGTAPARPAAAVFCHQCGTRHEADARFCDACGASLA